MAIDRRAVMGLGLAGAALAAASAQAQPSGLAGAIEVEGDAQGRYAAAFTDIRAYAERHMGVYGLPGLTICATAPQGVTAFVRLGYAQVETRAPITPDHLFQIGSISKSFTALCIFRLVDAGKLNLDDDVARLLPDVPLPAGARISVQTLLNHSSGLPDDAPLFPRGGDGRLWQGFAPGSRWSYSNLGFQMLGLIVERLEGAPLAAVIAERILRPLGMDSTRGAILTGDRARYAHGYSPFYGDRGYPRAGLLGPGAWTDMTAGSGCVASTAHDMALYCRYLAAAGQGRGAPVLSDAAAVRFTRATIDAPGWATPDSKYANGLAVVEVGGRPLLHHTGGMLAFNSALHVDPQAGVGAFASTNVGMAPYRPRDITAYACARLRAVVEGAAVPPPPAAPPPMPPLQGYAGAYEGPRGQRLTVSADPKGLSVRLGDLAMTMEPSEKDAFIATDPSQSPFPLVFRRDGPTVTRAWHGGVEHVRVEGGRTVAPFSLPTPADLSALTGRYESDDPWAGGFRVMAQGAALFLDDTTPIVPLGGGLFRVGDDDWSPERLRFDGLIDGRPMRAIASGSDHVRRTT